MKFMRYSEGVLCVDPEQDRPTDTSIKFVTATELYRELVEIVGANEALQTIQSGSPVLPEAQSETSEDFPTI
jgi:hypothetical protein